MRIRSANPVRVDFATPGSIPGRSKPLHAPATPEGLTSFAIGRSPAALHPELIVQLTFDYPLFPR